MEHKGHDESTQGVLGFKCKKILPVEKKSSASHTPDQSAEIVEKNYSVENFAFPTPEKTTQSSRTKNKVISLPLKAVKQDEGKLNEEEAVELPDKYKTIAEFFDRIGSSVRLLRLYKKLPTFQNICTQVEVLTKRQVGDCRKLKYSHLAQIKYMLPEFIQIEKTLVHDEKTLCMKPDLKVTLLLDVVEAHPDQSPFMVLRQVFHSKLLAFFNSNPEDSDIPEATLPVLSGQKNDTCSLEPLPTESCINSNPAPEPELLSNPSHLSPSFNSCFSHKVLVPDTEKTQLLASTLPLLPVTSGDGINQEISSQEKESSFLDSKTSSSKSHAELIFSPRSFISSSAFEDSPLSVLDPRQSRIETPVQSTPSRRTMPSSDDKIISRTRMPSCHTAAKRSLDFFSSLEGEGSASSFIVEESKQDRDNRLKTDSSLAALMQTGGENTTKMSQTVFARKQRMLASLLDLFNLIHHIFQSVKRASITKQELLHKIILENFDIVETREVEEQLELLEKLVPDWICSKLVPSGDLLYSIKKVSDLESIRARLVDAV